MVYLVRKLVLSRWPDGENLIYDNNINHLSADCITKELNTSSNQLSWWKAENDLDLNGIAVSYCSKIVTGTDKFWFIKLPFEELTEKFIIKNTPENGYTAIPKMKEKHYDMCNLNYESLGQIGDIIANATSSVKNIYKVKVKQALKDLKDLLDAGEVDVNLLGKYSKEKLVP